MRLQRKENDLGRIYGFQALPQTLGVAETEDKGQL